MSNYLVTGCAGFIGYHLCRALMKQGHLIIGIDHLDNYNYPREFKQYRVEKLKELRDQQEVAGLCSTLIGEDVEPPTLRYIFNMWKFDGIFHLAAIPGVRESMRRPHLYIENNITASVRLLMAAGEMGIKKVVMASSSSVYGNWGQVEGVPDVDKMIPTTEGYPYHPLSPYAMTKTAMEASGFIYHKHYGMDITALRYFTVYGPMGRPDMAYFKFIHRLMQGKHIQVYGDGKQMRDMTYIDDAVEATIKAMELEGYNILNVGTGKPVQLQVLIGELCEQLQLDDPEVRYMAEQPGDVRATYADTSWAKEQLGWEAKVDIDEGISLTIGWFKENWDEIHRILGG